MLGASLECGGFCGYSGFVLFDSIYSGTHRGSFDHKSQSSSLSFHSGTNNLYGSITPPTFSQLGGSVFVYIPRWDMDDLFLSGGTVYFVYACLTSCGEFSG